MMAFWGGYIISPHTVLCEMPALYYMVVVGAFYGLVLSLCSRLSGVPRPEHVSSAYEFLAAACLGVLFGYVVFTAATGLVIHRLYGRYISAGIMVISLAGIAAPRIAVRALLPLGPLRIAIHGSIPRCHEADILGRQGLFDVVGWFAPIHARAGAAPVAGLPLLGDISDLSCESASRVELDVLVLCQGDYLTHEEGLAVMCLPAAGIEVLTLGAFLERFHRKVSVEGCSAN